MASISIFERLPGELRNQIYEYLLLPDPPRRLTRKDFENKALEGTSRADENELYSEIPSASHEPTRLPEGRTCLSRANKLFHAEFGSVIYERFRPVLTIRCNFFQRLSNQIGVVHLRGVGRTSYGINETSIGYMGAEMHVDLISDVQASEGETSTVSWGKFIILDERNINQIMDAITRALRYQQEDRLDISITFSNGTGLHHGKVPQGLPSPESTHVRRKILKALSNIRSPTTIYMTQNPIPEQEDYLVEFLQAVNRPVFWARDVIYKRYDTLSTGVSRMEWPMWGTREGGVIAGDLVPEKQQALVNHLFEIIKNAHNTKFEPWMISDADIRVLDFDSGHWLVFSRARMVAKYDYLVLRLSQSTWDELVKDECFMEVADLFLNDEKLLAKIMRPVGYNECASIRVLTYILKPIIRPKESQDLINDLKRQPKSSIFVQSGIKTLASWMEQYLKVKQSDAPLTAEVMTLTKKEKTTLLSRRPKNIFPIPFPPIRNPPIFIWHETTFLSDFAKVPRREDLDHFLKFRTMDTMPLRETKGIELPDPTRETLTTVDRKIQSSEDKLLDVDGRLANTEEQPSKPTEPPLDAWVRARIKNAKKNGEVIWVYPGFVVGFAKDNSSVAAESAVEHRFWTNKDSEGQMENMKRVWEVDLRRLTLWTDSQPVDYDDPFGIWH